MTKKILKAFPPTKTISLGNSISIYKQIFPKQKITMHWHDFYEFEIILDGSGSIICNDKEYILKPGTVSFLSPRDFHELNLTSDALILCVHFTDESISKEIMALFYNLENNVIYADEKQLERTILLCDLLKNNFIHGYSGNMYLSRLLETLLLSFKKDFNATSDKYKLAPTPIQKAIIYINAHFKENPKLSDVAKSLFLNENYFSTLFKESMGESYKNYIKKLKLNHAANLIQHSKLSITQILSESGYSSQPHFNHDFKNYFGVSPKDMRKNINTEN